MENQLRWTCIPKEFGDPSEWTFVIINTRKRELGTRRAKILTELRPIDDYEGSIDGKVKQTYYMIMRLLSHSPPADKILEKLYEGKIVPDRKLAEKTNNDSLESYVQNLLK